MNNRPLQLTALLLIAALLLAACALPAPLATTESTAEDALTADATMPDRAAEDATAADATTEDATAADTAPGRRGFGPQSNMMQRHHAPIPEEYVGLANPIAADAESLARGQALYAALCVTCHGESGMGEGSIGQTLDPAPAPIAHTSQMLSDGYLFWRISEGGSHFDTAMPAWDAELEEQERWDLVNYVRSLGDSEGGMGMGPGMGMGDEAEHRAEMLAEALDQGIISAEEAELFEQVHQVLDEHYATGSANMESMGPGGMRMMQRSLTDQAVRDGHISQADADRFTAIHDLLIDSDVMQ